MKEKTKKTGGKVMIILLVILIVILLVFMIVSYIAYKETFYSQPSGKEKNYNVSTDSKHPKHKDIRHIMEAEFAAVDSDRVYTESCDGLKLSAHIYERNPEMPIVIGFHCYRSSALYDFSGMGSYLVSQGYNLILPDHRAHELSEGNCITFGIKERYDVLSWVRYASEYFGEDKKIILYGISMGAASVLMASDLDLPENVVGIIADCGFASPEEAIRKSCDNQNLPSALFYPFVEAGAKIFGHFNLDEASAVTSVKNTKVPIILFHGKEDNTVPFSSAENIYASNPSMIELHSFPGADHAVSYYTDEDRYKQLAETFIQKCIQ